MAMDHTSAAGSVPAPPPSQAKHLVILEGGDRRWKRLTEQANTAYAQGDISLARAAYDDALTEAERLFEAAMFRPVPFPAPVIYNVSCHNLAELHEKAGKQEEAGAFYRQAYDKLLLAAESASTPLGLRVSCVQHLKHALAVLVQHMRSARNSDHLIGDVTDRAHNTAYSVFRIAQHARQADANCPHCPITVS